MECIDTYMGLIIMSSVQKIIWWAIYQHNVARSPTRIGFGLRTQIRLYACRYTYQIFLLENISYNLLACRRFGAFIIFTRWVIWLPGAGLDPASPLFRQMLSASLLSLSSDDASFVDVVHTDGARIWSEGFGLFNPIGDVDYFPNGGLDQPGCEQVRGSVIVSRFGKSYKIIYKLHIIYIVQMTLFRFMRDAFQANTFFLFECVDAVF